MNAEPRFFQAPARARRRQERAHVQAVAREQEWDRRMLRAQLQAAVHCLRTAQRQAENPAYAEDCGRAIAFLTALMPPERAAAGGAR